MELWQKEKTKTLIELFSRAPIVRTMGMRLEYTDDARARILLPYNPDFDHGLHAIHGGVYMTLLDNAGWFTSAASIREHIWVATSSMNVHLLRPAKRVDLVAEGWIIKSGRGMDICEMRLFDQYGTLVGHATGTYVKLINLDYSRETDND